MRFGANSVPLDGERSVERRCESLFRPGDIDGRLVYQDFRALDCDSSDCECPARPIWMERGPMNADEDNQCEWTGTKREMSADVNTCERVFGITSRHGRVLPREIAPNALFTRPLSA